MTRFGRLRVSTAVAAALAAFVAAFASGATASPTDVRRAHAHNRTRLCVYDHNSIAGLAAFAALVGRRTVDCAMVYTGSADWSGWMDPWFLHHPDRDLNWAAWERRSVANDRRQLIISQPLIPSSLASTDWREAGAAGAYERYARRFARTLV